MVWTVCSMDEQSRGGALGWTADDDDPKSENKAVAAVTAGPFACFHPGSRGNKTSAEFLECDYEKNCTPLYRAIEDEDWEHVHHFLLHGYWPGKLFYDPTSAADQARTWVTRYHYPPGGGSNGSKNGGSSDQPVVLWSQLPLHLCCILNAPYDIVSRLLELYPAAARSLDDQTNLPLHIVLQSGASDQIVDLLLMSFPEAVNVKGKDGLTPLECADDKMVHGRVFKAIFGLDGSSIAADDHASAGVNSLLAESSNGNNKKAAAVSVSNNTSNSTFFGSFARGSNKDRPSASADAASSSSSSPSTSKTARQSKNDAAVSTDGKNLKASVDILRFNSLEFKTNKELAELRKELQTVASMAESLADVKELKSEIQNLRRQLRAKEHAAASAAAAAQQQLHGSRGSKNNKGKGKSKKNSSSSSPFRRGKSTATKNQSGVQKSLSWSKSSSRSRRQEQQVDNTDSVSLCSSVVSSKHGEYEVSMLPQASMLDNDSSSDDSSDDEDDNVNNNSADAETESSSSPTPRQPQPQPQHQQRKERSRKKKKQPEKRITETISQQQQHHLQRQKKQQQQQQQQQKKKQQQRQQQQDFDSDQTDHDIILAHHPRQVDSRCQCVIL